MHVSVCAVAASIAGLLTVNAALAQSEAGPSPAFRQGQVDRQTLAAWFNTLTGDNRAGADYWAAHRSLPNPGSCIAAPPSTGADWTAGCFAAQQKLAAPDVRRKTEPDYRLGWNNPPSPASAPAEVPSTAPTPSPPATVQATPSTSPPSASGSSCKEDWKQCKDNGDLVNNFSDYFLIQGACKTEATEEAKYGTPIWPGFWSGGAFGRFHGGTDYVKTGVVLAIEPDAQFQNQFGAMVHSTVVCKYDLNSKRVIDVDIVEH